MVLLFVSLTVILPTEYWHIQRNCIPFHWNLNSDSKCSPTNVIHIFKNCITSYLHGLTSFRQAVKQNLIKKNFGKYVNNEYVFRIQDRGRIVCYNIVSDIVVTSDCFNRLPTTVMADFLNDETLYNVSTWIGHECRMSEHCIHIFFRCFSKYCHRWGLCILCCGSFCMFSGWYVRGYFKRFIFLFHWITVAVMHYIGCCFNLFGTIFHFVYNEKQRKRRGKRPRNYVFQTSQKRVIETAIYFQLIWVLWIIELNSCFLLHQSSPYSNGSLCYFWICFLFGFITIRDQKNIQTA